MDTIQSQFISDFAELWVFYSSWTRQSSRDTRALEKGDTKRAVVSSANICKAYDNEE